MRTRTIQRRDGKRSGSLLVEAVVAAGLLSLFAGSAYLAANSATSSYRTRASSAHLVERASNAADEVAERLRPVDIASVTAVVGNLTLAEQIDFTRTDLPSGNPPSPVQSLVIESDPYDADDGVDNDGDGLIDELRLVWYENRGAVGERSLVLANGITEDFEGEIVGNLIDDNGNGVTDERGAGFAFADGRIVFLISVGENQNDRVLTHTLARTIALRNTP